MLRIGQFICLAVSIASGLAFSPSKNVLLVRGGEVKSNFSVPLANQSFSFAIWVKRSGLVGFDCAITLGLVNNIQASAGLHICYRPSNIFTFAFWGNDLNTNPYPDDFLTWVHWAGTYNSTTRARILYRNGVQAAFDISNSDFKGVGRIEVGGNSVLTSNSQLDDVRIYVGLVLSPADVASIMANAGAATDPSATLRYSFDDAPGAAIATDSGGQGNKNPAALIGASEIHTLCSGSGTTEIRGGACGPPPCPPGSTGPDANCTACQAGKYKAAYGPGACLVCPAGTYSYLLQWSPCAAEFQQCSCPAGAAGVRFGLPGAWLSPARVPAGPFACSVAAMGGDPAVGSLKSCQCAVATSAGGAPACAAYPVYTFAQVPTAPALGPCELPGLTWEVRPPPPLPPRAPPQHTHTHLPHTNLPRSFHIFAASRESRKSPDTSPCPSPPHPTDL